MKIEIHNNPKSVDWSKSHFKREVYSNISLLQKMRKISNTLNLHLKELEKEEQNLKLVEGTII